MFTFSRDKFNNRTFSAPKNPKATHDVAAWGTLMVSDVGDNSQVTISHEHFRGYIDRPSGER
jgi:hypothetical protein